MLMIYFGLLDSLGANSPVDALGFNPTGWILHVLHISTGIPFAISINITPKLHIS